MNKGENSARHKNKCFEAFSSSLYRDSNSYPFIHPHNTSTFAQHFKSASIFFCNVEKVWLCSSFVSLFVFLTLFFNQGFHWLLSFTTLSSLSGSKAGLLNSFFPPAFHTISPTFSSTIPCSHVAHILSCSRLSSFRPLLSSLVMSVSMRNPPQRRRSLGPVSPKRIYRNLSFRLRGGGESSVAADLDAPKRPSKSADAVRYPGVILKGSFGHVDWNVICLGFCYG